jgi:26S proteasome regulatory subunit N8
MKEQNSNIDRVVVHPLVLLSVVDHFNRAVVGSRNKRVVGVLLGNIYII